MSETGKFVVYLGYSETPCPECGRLRVEMWSDGHAECEKCNWSKDPSKWISVEERLPEPYHTYLVALKEKYSFGTEWRYHVDVADMVDGDGYIEGMWNTFNDWYEGQEIHVTHWMPLPEPPKEE